MRLLYYLIHRICQILRSVQQIFQHINWWFSSFFRSKHELAAEIVALISQLALYQLQQEKEIITKLPCQFFLRYAFDFATGDYLLAQTHLGRVPKGQVTKELDL